MRYMASIGLPNTRLHDGAFKKINETGRGSMVQRINHVQPPVVESDTATLELS